MQHCIIMRHILFIALLILSPITYAKVNVHHYTLTNGLQLFVIEDHRAPVVMSQIWYKVGSAYETPGRTGLAHMLEHMMFKGTTRFPGDTLTQLIADNGGQFNAGTSQDITYYYEMLPADKLALSFELEADRMQHLQLHQADFEKENQVVQEERRMRTDDNPQMATVERLYATAHLAAPYHHMPIGWMHDIQQHTLADLTKWYQQWYAPNNATLVVVGDVKADKVYQLAKKYFSNISKNPAITPLKAHREPPSLGPRHVTINIPAKVPYVLLAYNTPNINTAQPTWKAYALVLASAILTSGDSARLPQDLIRKQRLVTEIDAHYTPFTLFPDLFVIDATPTQDSSTDSVIDAIEQHIHRLQTTLVSQAELTKVKNQVIAGNVFSQDSIRAKANLLGQLVSLNLPWQTMNTYVDSINAVTAEQIQTVSKHYLIPDRRTIAVLVPKQVNDATHDKTKRLDSGLTHSMGSPE